MSAPETRHRPEHETRGGASFAVVAVDAPHSTRPGETPAYGDRYRTGATGRYVEDRERVLGHHDTERLPAPDPVGPVLAATAWTTNAHMIEDCARLGYLRPEWRTLDPTYGRGLWWDRWRPDELTAHDLRLDGVDFRDLPEVDGAFDAATFDPPYVCVGGRSTTGLADLHDRYGLTDAPRTPRDLQQLINDGLAEVVRVVRDRGLILAKGADYVSSGRLWPGTHHTLTHALALGCQLVDRLEHVSLSSRPQPPGRRQVHARRNLSTLLVLEVRR